MHFPKVAALFASLALALSPAVAQIGPPGGGSGGGVSSVTTACPASGPATGAVSLSGGVAMDAQTGTSYTIVAGDCGKLVTLNNASAVAVSLPVAGTTGFAAGFYLGAIQNLGVGAVTITPASCSSSNFINGVCTAVTLTKGQSIGLATDGTNWFAQAGLSTASGGGTVFPLTVSGTVTSGGIPYFSSGVQLATSAVLAANSLMVGGGAGVAPSTVSTGSGNLAALAIAANSPNGFPAINGSMTSGDCLKWSTTGIQDAGATCSGNPPISLVAGSTQFYPLFPGAQISSSSSAQVNGILYCAPFHVTQSYHIDEMVAYIATVGTTNVQYAIYTDQLDTTTHFHEPGGAPLANSGNLDNHTGLPGALTWTLGTPLALTPGLYWACDMSNDNTAKFTSLSPSSTTIAGLIGSTNVLHTLAEVSGAVGNVVGYTLSGQTFGSWPTLASSGVSWLENIASQLPNFAVRIYSVP
jgi:hypothetical protein